MQSTVPIPQEDWWQKIITGHPGLLLPLGVWFFQGAYIWIGIFHRFNTDSARQGKFFILLYFLLGAILNGLFIGGSALVARNPATLASDTIVPYVWHALPFSMSLCGVHLALRLAYEVTLAPYHSKKEEEKVKRVRDDVSFFKDSERDNYDQ